ncbi:MAG: OmpH family outer membrane protein [Verrucomicrobia bacterium]|nr:OmpH family outer membrane protein [Verrucomicrobiota bacterium]
MKRIARMVLSLCLLTATAGAQGFPYAVVDMEVLIKAHADTAIAESVLKKQADEYEAERAVALAELETLNKSFEFLREDAESRVLSEAGREEKRLEAQALIKTIREKENRFRETTSLRQKELADRRKRMRQRIVDEIQAIIHDYAKSQRIKLVLEKHSNMGGAEMVIFVDDSIDVTEPIQRRIEAATSE